MSFPERYMFKVQGSAPAPYTIEFARHADGNIVADCTCPAGSAGQYCKHRINILRGVKAGVLESSGSSVAADVAQVSAWLPGSDIEAALNEISDLERQAEAIKKAISSAKKRLARTLTT